MEHCIQRSISIGLMNNIPEDQLQKPQLDRLSAQRQLYTNAKFMMAIQIIITVPAAIMWSFSVMAFPALKVYALAWAISVILIDIFWWTPRQNLLKIKAAKIQELFDCDILHLEWPQIKAEEKPDQETIVQYATKYKKHNPQCATITNWYPDSIGKLPIHLARLVCQRSNCTWDMNLRLCYARSIIGVLIAIIIIIVVVGLITGLTLEVFLLAIIVPLFPAIIFGIRQCRANIQTAARLDTIKTHTMNLWNKAVKNEIEPEELAKKCRELQDEIYDHRRRCPLILDWIYEKFRNKSEELMKKTAKALIEEILNHGNCS